MSENQDIRENKKTPQNQTQKYNSQIYLEVYQTMTDRRTYSTRLRYIGVQLDTKRNESKSYENLSLLTNVVLPGADV